MKSDILAEIESFRRLLDEINPEAFDAVFALVERLPDELFGIQKSPAGDYDGVVVLPRLNKEIAISVAWEQRDFKFVAFIFGDDSSEIKIERGGTADPIEEFRIDAKNDAKIVELLDWLTHE